MIFYRFVFPHYKQFIVQLDLNNKYCLVQKNFKTFKKQKIKLKIVYDIISDDLSTFGHN